MMDRPLNRSYDRTRASESKASDPPPQPKGARKRKRRADDASSATASRKRTNRYRAPPVCTQCGTVIHEGGTRHVCRYHAYSDGSKAALFAAYGVGVWATHDGKHGGAIETDANKIAYPWAFGWYCCHQPANAPGCRLGEGHSRVGAQTEMSRLVQDGLDVVQIFGRILSMDEAASLQDLNRPREEHLVSEQSSSRRRKAMQSVSLESDSDSNSDPDSESETEVEALRRRTNNLTVVAAAIVALMAADDIDEEIRENKHKVLLSLSNLLKNTA